MHEHLERLTGMIFGTYVATPRSRYRRWPLYVGPVGYDVHPSQTYREAWRRANGFEVSVFGRCLYIARGA